MFCILEDNRAKTIPAQNISYWIRQKFTGQGLLTEAAKALIQLLLEKNNCDAIIIGSNVKNEKSIGVVKRLGLRKLRKVTLWFPEFHPEWTEPVTLDVFVLYKEDYLETKGNREIERLSSIHIKKFML